MPDFSILSTFPPTRCGIATFSESLAAALVEDGSTRVRIVRLVDRLDTTRATVVDARTDVALEWGAGRGDAGFAARALESADVAIVQHEFGIYPGPDGAAVLDVLRALTVPSILVLHTVLDAPSPHQRKIIDSACELATRVIVMSKSARRLLIAEYDVDERSVLVIPHGVPAWAAVEPAVHRRHPTMLTWGLIGPGKGIEWGIRALAEPGGLDPTLRYEVLGATHPKVVANDGEAYRDSLRLLAVGLGVADRVIFDDRYLDRAALARRVAAADLVLLPYESGTQATSGVLVEAVAAGKSVVATGFPHALELLADGLGTLVPHRDPHAIASAAQAILAAGTGSRRARGVRTTQTPWPIVADRYRELAAELRSAAVPGRYGRTA